MSQCSCTASQPRRRRSAGSRITLVLTPLGAKTLEDPRTLGEALRGPKLGQFWKYRVCNYRIIANIRDHRLVIVVVRVGNRREVYDR